jgi:antirestriction protein
MPSPRQQEYYEEHTSEECRVEDRQQDYYEESTSEEDREEDDDATVCVGNLPYGIDSEYLGQLFEYAGIVVFSEVSLLSHYGPCPVIDR